MFDHVSISVPSIERSRLFYINIMKALSIPLVGESSVWLGFGERANKEQPLLSYLSILESDECSSDYKRHLCFKAKDREEVNAFYKAGLANGGKCDGEVGLRENYHSHYYACFLKDPAGNRIEVVCHQ
ncbi:VOC family protein [Psychromonas sp. SP041]|uniref:VOC family protein n=1 Tax=Psychromonas sp. SP041 TaxID=1365007 RepID=UPI0010C7AA66|nr:VOC family protein [Psychromonas sp. SP041]